MKDLIGTSVLVRAQPGTPVRHAVEQALRLATELGCAVDLTFNGKVLKCAPHGDADGLVRQYLLPRSED